MRRPFDFPTLVSKVEQTKTLQTDGSRVQLPSVYQNASSFLDTNDKSTNRHRQSHDNLSYKDFIGYVGGTGKDSLHASRMMRKNRQRFH